MYSILFLGSPGLYSYNFVVTSIVCIDIFYTWIVLDTFIYECCRNSPGFVRWMGSMITLLRLWSPFLSWLHYFYFFLLCNTASSIAGWMIASTVYAFAFWSLGNDFKGFQWFEWVRLKYHFNHPNNSNRSLLNSFTRFKDSKFFFSHQEKNSKNKFRRQCKWPKIIN